MTSALREVLDLANKEYSNACGGILDGWASMQVGPSPLRHPHPTLVLALELSPGRLSHKTRGMNDLLARATAWATNLLRLRRIRFTSPPKIICWRGRDLTERSPIHGIAPLQWHF
jgi:hypothetical protein